MYSYFDMFFGEKPVQCYNQPTTMEPNICQVCHQPILSTYYFCPNCGAKVNEPPLKTDTSSQVKIYLFSVVLPMICFIFVTKWPGLKYYKSNDAKAKRIGQIAFTLLVVSTIATIVFAYTWTQSVVQEQINSINTDFGAF